VRHDDLPRQARDTQKRKLKGKSYDAMNSTARQPIILDRDCMTNDDTVRKRIDLFLRCHFVLKMIIVYIPRQARDKHRVRKTPLCFNFSHVCQLFVPSQSW
jgi:hypothetical protein